MRRSLGTGVPFRARRAAAGRTRAGGGTGAPRKVNGSTLLATAGWPPIDPLALVPGLALAVLAVLLLTVGYRWGRWRVSSSVGRLVRSLRAVTGGDYTDIPELPRTDPLAPAAAALAGLAQELAAREREPHPLLGRTLDHMDDEALVLLDPALSVRAASATAARWLGLDDPVKLRGRRAAELFEAGGWERLAPQLTDERRLAQRPEAAVVLAGGDRMRLRVRAFPVPDGLVLRLERAAEPGGEPPREAAERLRDLFERLVDGLLVVSGGRVVEANRVARDWAGRDLAGVPLRELIPAEDLLLALDRVQRGAAGEPVEPFRCRLLGAGGPARSREVEAIVSPLHYRGEPAAAVTLRDLGAERHAVRRARLQKARLLAVMDAVGDGLLVLRAPRAEGRPWRISLANRKARELLGEEGGPLAAGAPEEDLWKRLAPRIDEPERLARFVRAARERSEAEHAELFELAGAPRRWVELVFRPVRGSAGELVGRVLVLRDVTRHREVERQLREDAALLERSHRTLQEAYEQLAAATRALGRRSEELERVDGELRELDEAHLELLGTVAHELQTPLVSIRGYAQMLADGRLGRVNEEQRSGLQRILAAVDRMVGLIDNLLALARSGGRSEFRPEPVPVAPVVREVVDRHRARAASAEVELADEPVPEGLAVLAERDALEQVLDNLVSNAIKFNRRGGRVTVRARTGAEGRVAIEVEDTGVGIDPAERERIFERFYRGRAAARVAGSGIGLATVRAIVERHGGQIDVASTPGRGTTFRILWPVAQREGAAS
ncbi:MAG: PAS domain-containing protein [Acidobacteria bacterium]|nr:MAG: PAS domain-containing protein [Acidobacteriota bacterium]